MVLFLEPIRNGAHTVPNRRTPILEEPAEDIRLYRISKARSLRNGPAGVQPDHVFLEISVAARSPAPRGSTPPP